MAKISSGPIDCAFTVCMSQSTDDRISDTDLSHSCLRTPIVVFTVVLKNSFWPLFPIEFYSKLWKRMLLERESIASLEYSTHDRNELIASGYLPT